MAPHTQRRVYYLSKWGKNRISDRTYSLDPDGNPQWSEPTEYRVVQKHQKLYGQEVPEAENDVLERDTPYWVPNIAEQDVIERIWRYTAMDARLMQAGMVFLTADDAYTYAVVAFEHLSKGYTYV